MQRKTLKYLDDILHAISLVDLFLEETPSFRDFEEDLKTQSAVERQIAIIGEAANQIKKIDQTFALRHEHQIRGMRNLLIHAYDNTDPAIVWNVATAYLPDLKVEITTLISKNT